MVEGIAGGRVRAACPECGRVMQLNADGTVRHHGGQRGGTWNYRAYRCPGAGQQPHPDAPTVGIHHVRWVALHALAADLAADLEALS